MTKRKTRKPHTATVKRIRSMLRLMESKRYLLYYRKTAYRDDGWTTGLWKDGEFRAFGLQLYWNEVAVWELPDPKEIS